MQGREGGGNECGGGGRPFPEECCREWTSCINKTKKKKTCFQFDFALGFEAPGGGATCWPAWGRALSSGIMALLRDLPEGQWESQLRGALFSGLPFSSDPCPVLRHPAALVQEWPGFQCLE